MVVGGKVGIETVQMRLRDWTVGSGLTHMDPYHQRDTESWEAAQLKLDRTEKDAEILR